MKTKRAPSRAKKPTRAKSSTSTSKTRAPSKRASSSPSKRKSKKRKYEGASKSKRLSRWFSGGGSANTEVQGSLITLRNRSRDLRRNNPYAAKGIQVITSNVVGHGISTQFRGSNAETLEALWKTWAETPMIDFDGRNNIYGLQRLIMDAVVESGEVLVRKRFNAALDFPLQYQVLESDFLDLNKNEMTDQGNTIIQGIEFDKQGRRVAYWLFENHPGGYDSTALAFTNVSNRIPADEVQHVYRMDRPGQARGIPWLAPVIIRLKDLDDYEDAQLMRQKIAACFTAFVRDITADLTDAIDADEDEDELSERIEPAMIEHLPSGKTIEFAKPPEVQGYRDYIQTVLHGIAAGLGISYEAFTGDLSDVNFSSARMGWLEMGRNLKAWREHVLIAHSLDPIAKDFLQTASIMGVRTEGTTFVHVAPAREMIDPTKEIPASILAVRAGLETLSDELMARGKDPEEHLEQYAKDMQTLDKLGLKVEADPRVEKAKALNSKSDEGDEENEEEDQASGESRSSVVQARIIRREAKYN